MKLQDFRVGLRILLKDPVYSLVAILGLAVGLAACLLLLGFARYSWEYNAHIPDIDNVYTVKQRKNLDLGSPWYDQSPVGLRQAALATPGVMAASGYVGWFPLYVKVNGNPQKLRSFMVLPDYEEMIGLQAIKGDLKDAFSRPDGLVITQATAVRLFGTSDVLGQSVQLSSIDDGNPNNPPSSCPARIAAIVRTPAANTTIKFEALHGVHICFVPPWMGAQALTGDMGWPGNVLVRLHPDASVTAVTESLQKVMDHSPLQNVPPEMKPRLGNRKAIDIKLSALRDAYFDHEALGDRHTQPVDRGDRNVVASLVAIGILVLTLAAINYVNLATIRVIRRQREIAMRKVLGARKGRLAQQFVAESLLVSTLATVMGVLMAWLLLPVFGELMNRDLSSVLSFGNVGIALLIGLALGLLTAIYPIWIAFGVRPARMLAGRPDTESFGSKRLRQALSVLQIAVAMGLASYTLAIFWQTRFAMEASPGFNPAPLLVLEFPHIQAGTKKQSARNFMTALTQQPAVAGVAMSIDAIGRNKDPSSTEIKREGAPGVTMDVKSVSPGFFEQYGINPVAGRLFDSKIDQEEDRVPIVINALAARQLGFASPELAVGQVLLFGGAHRVTKRIVGVAPEIRFYSLREAPRAVAYNLLLFDATLTVRASGSVAEAEQAVRKLWPQYFPNASLEISSAKSIYAANYADDARLAKLLAISTVIAMIIAAFGAYALAADAVQRRSGEIALRKLFGARKSNIGKLIAKDVGVIIFPSAVVALPLAWLAIARYLSAYTEQTPLAYWALALALLVALATVSFAAARHAWIAMMLKPAVALRG